MAMHVHPPTAARLDRVQVIHSLVRPRRRPAPDGVGSRS